MHKDLLSHLLKPTLQAEPVQSKNTKDLIWPVGMASSVRLCKFSVIIVHSVSTYLSVYYEFSIVLGTTLTIMYFIKKWSRKGVYSCVTLSQVSVVSINLLNNICCWFSSFWLTHMLESFLFKELFLWHCCPLGISF